MPSYTQEGRLISLITPLGPDKLLLAGFSGQEAVSRLFNFHLDLLQETWGGPGVTIDFTQIVGQSVTIQVIQSDDSLRYFNGLVSHFALTGIEGTFARYEMQMVPALWKLTRSANCRIFHNKDVKQIITSVFDTHGFSDFEINAPDAYPILEYCVQYRETDFNFVSRLMEQYGLFYYFEHGDGTHTMKILDAAASVTECPKQAQAQFDLVAGGLDEDDVVTAWTVEQEWKSGKVTHTDYNFKTPAANLEASQSTPESVAGNSTFEIYDYPGEYGKLADGKFLAERRIEEEEAGIMIARGSSVCRAFTSGYKFALSMHPFDDLNNSYILTEIQHVASIAGTYGLGSNKDSYVNHFACVRDNVKYRPARLSPKPFVQGPQTAVVVGKNASQVGNEDATGGDGEEIWVDKYGRVLVKFFWDREDACSCWVRVSQDWAGQSWGMINIPRVGQEVIVSFLEGDPDRPLITGRVYNDDQKVPYELPANGTRTTFKTRSTPGAGADNYNELRFEDKKGSEQIFVRGEMDYDTRIKHDSREWIGNDQSLIVKNDRKEKIGKDDHLNIAGNLNEKVGQTISIQAGTNLYSKSGTNYAHEAGTAIHLKAGTTMVLEAGVQLSLKAGGSFIDIGPAGIAISGAPLVMINSGGSAGSGSGSSPTAPQDPDEADDGSKGTKM